MSNFFCYLRIAVLALVGTAAMFGDFTQSNVTLESSQNFNLENGAMTSSGGDFEFTGSSITFAGNALGYTVATGVGPGGYALYNEATLQAFYGGGPGVYSKNPIVSPALAVNTVFAVYDNSKHFAKVLITGLTSSSITFQFLTYGATGGAQPGAPTISKIQNNYSNVALGLPNYGIAPSTIFVIYGTGMADPTAKAALQSSASPGIPSTFNGASIAVTVNGVTTHPAMYYAIATQIAAVLPANTPVGTGTLTVTYNGLTSAPATIQVVESALGLDTLSGLPEGLAVATDSNGNVFNYTTSASPNQTITLWGSGLGADTADSDVEFTSSPHAVNVPLKIYVGGIEAQVTYAGSSGYPGLVQINVKIPSNVTPGCGVPIIGVVGTFVSNSVTIPIGQNGGVCQDDIRAMDGNALIAVGSQVNYSSGTLAIVLDTTQKGTQSVNANAAFIHIANQPNTYGYGYVTEGGCLTFQEQVNLTGTLTYLNAGNLTITGPTGTQPITQVTSGQVLAYGSSLPTSFFPSTGGTFTFQGTGGKDIGPFSVTVSDPSPLVWTNQAAITSVNRNQDLKVTWTGGIPGTWVQIGGGSTTVSVSGTFICFAPVSAGQFTIPSYVLLASPVSSGGISLINQSNNEPFHASGLDISTAVAETESSISVPFN